MAAPPPENPGPVPPPAMAVPAGPNANVAAAAPIEDTPLLTKRNRRIVEVDGFPMAVQRTSKNGRLWYWRCVQANKYKCTVRGTSTVGSYDIQLTDRHARHMHEADRTQAQIRRIKSYVKTQAVHSKTSSAANTIDTALRGATADVHTSLPRENLLRIAKRAKELDGRSMVDRPLERIEWPDAFKNNVSDAGLALLRDHADWAMDGTFDCVPPTMKKGQLFTLHAVINHSCLPGAFILLPNKEQATYERAFRALKASPILQRVQPESVMSDMELAAINAMRTVFSPRRQRACVFHLGQVSWRNISERGLAPIYRASDKVKSALRCFVSLAFLPLVEVVDGLDNVVAHLNHLIDTGEVPQNNYGPLESFIDYFERTYIRRLINFNHAFGPVRLEPALWNCHEDVLRGLHRSNNAIEGWNRQFNGSFGHSHPAMSKLVYKLQEEEDKARQAVVKRELFPARPVRGRHRLPKYMRADAELQALTQNYANTPIDQRDRLRFLKSIQFHLGKPNFHVDQRDGSEESDESSGSDSDDSDGEDNLNQDPGPPGLASQLGG